MKNRLIGSLFMIISMQFMPTLGHAQATSDYLILQDISPYRLSQPKAFRTLAPVGGPHVGKDAGVVGSSHFPDHVDTTYKVMYLGNDNYASPTVTITQHAGGDTDKWLLHEIEDIYRDSNVERLGLLLKGAFTMNLDANKVFSHGIGGGGYTWLSNNNVVVDISYTSLVAGKPKPTELVQAYLAKFPSIIPVTFALNGAHDVVWRKDEMERRLWLCDKWVLKIQPDDSRLYKTLEEIVDNVVVFLDFREKYFGITAKDEKQLLLNALSKKDEPTIRLKLQDCKV